MVASGLATQSLAAFFGVRDDEVCECVSLLKFLAKVFFFCVTMCGGGLISNFRRQRLQDSSFQAL